MSPTIETFWFNHLAIQQAARRVKRGDVIAYPTEAVWGLGCDPLNKYAVRRLLLLKQRPVEKGVILVAAAIEQFDFILNGLEVEQYQRLNSTWPGHNTWVVPNNGMVPTWISGDHPGVALRVSTHPLVRALCRRVGGPLVSTSANPAGKVPVKAGWQVRRYFRDSPLLDFIVPGCVGQQRKPSTIRDIETGKIFR